MMCLCRAGDVTKQYTLHSLAYILNAVSDCEQKM